MIKNTNESYGSVTKFLHWFMAMAIIFLLAVGYFLEELQLYKLHKALGFVILILAVIRLCWRFMNPVPGYDKDMPKLMVFAGHMGHYFLYALMIAMPLSAFIASNAAMKWPVSFIFLFDMPFLWEEKNVGLAKFMMEIHSILAIIFIVIISAHVLAAFYHHFIRKDNILTRMLPKCHKDKH